MAFALACAPLSASALETADELTAASALQTEAAKNGYQFTVDNIVYSVNVDKYVFVWDVADPDTLSPVVTIPSTIVDPSDGTTYNVVGVAQDAFDDCANLVDLRIGDLGTGVVYPQAFDRCTNLKVVHFLGRGGFGNPMHYTNDFDTKAVTDLAIVVHTGAWAFSSASNVIFPQRTTIYYKTDFVQGTTTTTAYVKGESSVDGTISAGVRVGDLADSESVDVYCDASEGEDSICPVASVPRLTSDAGRAWSYVPYSSDGKKSFASADDTVKSCATATEIDLHDLSKATIALENASITYTGFQIKPVVSVKDARGDVVDSENYAVTYRYASNGDIVPADRLQDVGTYKVRATGTGSYTGYCEADFSIVAPAATWSRAVGVDRYATAQAASTQMTAFANAFSLEAPSANKRVLVNSDDWASCMLADSLAGLFGCSVVTCSADELPARSLSPGLTGARQGDVIVVGPSSSIGPNVVGRVGEAVSGSVSRITGSSTSAQAMAVAAYDNIKKAESGAITLNLGDKWEGYGKTCMLVSESANDAATFSAMPWVYAERAAVFFMNDAGQVDASTFDRIASGGFTKIVALGATDRMLTALTSQFASIEAIEDVSGWQGGSDVYASSAAYAAQAVQEGDVNYGALGIVATSDWGVLASAAASCGFAKGSLLLEDFSNSQAAVASCDRVKQLESFVSVGCVFGNYNDIPAKYSEDLAAIWEDSSDSNNLHFGALTLDSTSIKSSGDGVVVAHKLVDSNGRVLTRGTDYTVLYYDNATGEKLSGAPSAPGVYTITCKGTLKSTSTTIMSPAIVSGTYFNTRSEVFTVTQGPVTQTVVTQTVTFANQTKTVKAAKVKKAKQTVSIAKAKAKTAVTYSIAKVNKSKAKFSINKKTGKITVKKGLGKGTYKVTVKAAAKATAEYKAASKTAVITIKVK